MNKKSIIILYLILLFLFLNLNKSCIGAYSCEFFNLGLNIRNYINSINNNLSEEQLQEISTSIIEQSKYYNIPWYITLAIIEAESSFDQFAVGTFGERGLMQIYTMECFNIKIDENRLFEIEYNIATGLCILSNKLKMYNNDYNKAIMRYNGVGVKAKKYLIKILNILNNINEIFYK